MSFSQRLKEARLAKGYTQQEVADQIGVAKSTYSGYENGFREPDVPKIKKLINVLDCPSSFLLEDGKEQGNKKRPELTADERQLISSYQMLDDHGRKVVINLLQEEVSRILDQEKQLEIIEVIVYDFPAAAGIPLFVEDDSYERIGFPAEQVPKGTDFGIRILGDSMEPTIKDRDIVFVRKTIKKQFNFIKTVDITMLLCYTIINKEEEATTMAKATITYTCKVCGETATASTTKHNRRDADAWEAWAIDHYDTCPDCYRKMQEQAMADKAAELAKLYSLPEITGLSQKQIDYAADLRAKYIAKNKQMCDAMQQMFTKFDYAQINTLAAQNNLTPDEYIKKSLQNDPNWGIVYTMLKVFDAKEIIEFAKGK